MLSQCWNLTQRPSRTVEGGWRKNRWEGRGSGEIKCSSPDWKKCLLLLMMKKVMWSSESWLRLVLVGGWGVQRGFSGSFPTYTVIQMSAISNLPKATADLNNSIKKFSLMKSTQANESPEMNLEPPQLLHCPGHPESTMKELVLWRSPSSGSGYKPQNTPNPKFKSGLKIFQSNKCHSKKKRTANGFAKHLVNT